MEVLDNIILLNKFIYPLHWQLATLKTYTFNTIRERVSLKISVKIRFLRTLLVVQRLTTCLPMQVTQVCFLVGEWGHHMPQDN